MSSSLLNRLRQQLSYIAPPSAATALRPPPGRCDSYFEWYNSQGARCRNYAEGAGGPTSRLPGTRQGEWASQTGRTSRRSLADLAGPALVANLLCRGQEKRTMRKTQGRFSMKKFGMTVTAFSLLLGALALASAEPAITKNTILTNRIGPSGGELFIAN